MTNLSHTHRYTRAHTPRTLNDPLSKNTHTHSGKQKSVRMIDVIMIPHLLTVSGAYFFVKLIRYTLLFWLPYFLIKQLNYEPSLAGFCSMFYDFGGIFGAVATGYVSDKVFHGRRLSAAALMCLATGCSILAFAWASHGGLVLTCTAMFFVGFSVAGPDSVLGAAAAQDLCERSGHGLAALSVAAGVVNGMGSIGAVVQGYLTAYVSEHFGWDTLFGALCLMSVLATMLLFPPLMADAHRQRRARNQSVDV
eukprot:GDKI01000939.1.p1 GENE.GDKI01000939.1~~GDKI01000939.1.p1  ORF type:complete len:281 (+),score=50.68 GDKI01000939.1:93-845(+)